MATFVFGLADTLLGCTYLRLLSAAQAGKLTAVDQLLPAPYGDRLVADAQIGSDLSGTCEGDNVKRRPSG